jgi:hypothetical protein
MGCRIEAASPEAKLRLIRRQIKHHCLLQKTFGRETWRLPGGESQSEESRDKKCGDLHAATPKSYSVKPHRSCAGLAGR